MSLGMKPENFQSILPGQRRRPIEKAGAIRFPNQWESNEAGRRKQFSEWRYVAMQVLQIHGVRAHRVVAIFDEVFDWGRCEIRSTDEEFALQAGHCATKTISRELRDLRELGLIIVDPIWIEKCGKKVKGRRIRLSFPKDLRDDVHVR